jgi:nucleoid-associated protein YgaU
MSQSRYKSSIGKVKRANTSAIYSASISGALDTEKIVLNTSQRLDTLAGQYYGDAQYWWVIAASSGIGWALQVPAGTVIRIPRNVQSAINLVG